MENLIWLPVVSIEPDGEEECVCISVSHPSRLYVAEGGIVTHNTTVDSSRSLDQSEANDSPRDIFEFRPRDETGLSFAAQETIAGLRRRYGGVGLYPRTAFLAHGRKHEKTANPLLNEIKRVFGKSLLFVDGPLDFDAASSPDARNIVIVNTAASEPLISLAGHELVHAIKAQQPEVWARMRDGLLKLASNWNDYKSRLSKLKYTDAQMVDEFLGDFVGSQFRNPDFWRQANETHPSIFRTLARAALDFLNNILGKISRDTQKYFSNLYDARAVVIDALAQYSQGPMPDRVLNDSGLESSRMETTYRTLPDAVTELQEGMKWARSTREQRTVDGELVPATAYDVRTDIAMRDASEGVMDSINAEGLSGAELMTALRNRTLGGQRMEMDERQILMRHMIQTGRFHELGVSRRELMSLMQEGAGVGAMAMREMREVLDPIEQLRIEGERLTGEEILRVTGQDADVLHGEMEAQVMGAQETAVNAELEKLRAEASELRKTLDQHRADLVESREGAVKDRLAKEEEIRRLQNLLNLAESQVADLESRPSDNAEANTRLAEDLLKTREQAAELRKKIKDLQTALAEETERANQQLEVGVAIGREEGRVAADEEWAARQPEAQLERFEQWLMGESIDGIESVETFARRYLQASRFDATGFSNAVMALFPAVDPHILEDAMDRVNVSLSNAAAAARRREIQNFVDRLAGRVKKPKDGERLGRFLGSLQRASDFGILDQDLFTDAFAHAFELNGMTPAVAQRLLGLWHDINRLDANGRRAHFGMVRETLEREFLETVNAIAPGARWDNFLFNQFQSAVLSSLSSGMNQFSGIFRALSGIDATARLAARGNYNPADMMAEWWRNVSDLFSNLPLVLTGLRGESLGHNGAHVRGNFTPMEQQMQLARQHPLRLRLPGGRTVTMPAGLSRLLRIKELYAWRIIRAAEGLSGVTDAQSRFRDTLTAHFQAQGMKPGQARQAALNAMTFSPAQRAAAEAQALAEQAAGRIGTGRTVVRRRTEEILNDQLDAQMGDEIVARSEHLTAAAQFKTMPTGPIGFAIANFMKTATKPEGAGRAMRFLFLFGRFLGHTVDTTLAYTPILHFATRGRQGGTSPRHNVIEEVYGSVREYNAQQHGKAVAGGAFLLMVGVLQALANALADDDEEPFFAITGFAPGADPVAKERLKATGLWDEGQIRIGGKPVFNFSQLPELVPLLTMIGNMSDWQRFDSALYRRKAEDGEEGVQAMRGGEIVVAAAGDVLLAPLKRSTYRQWVNAFDSLIKGRKTDSVANILTSPIGGALRIPLLVDADRIYRQVDGAMDAKGWVENTLRRMPFVQVGDRMFNPYGEQLPGFDAFGMFPSDAKTDPDVQRAANLNLQTRTSRGVPQLTLKYADGSVRETPREMQEAYVRSSGKLFVESMLRNEDAVKRAFETGGQAAAQKIVDNITRKANERAKAEVIINE